MPKWMSILSAVAMCGIVGLAPPARAATIEVNTEADSVADDGACSLREAVGAANTGRASGSTPGECVAGNPLPAVDVVRIPRGVYRLSLGGPGEDRNAGGDLDGTQSVVIEGAGRGKTILKNGIGDPGVEGDGDRLFYVDPAGKGGVDVTIRALSMTRGDVGCSGENCTTGASAVEADGDGALTLEKCRVVKNASTCSGIGCGAYDAAAIAAVGGGALTIRRSTIMHNRAHCEAEQCKAGGAGILMNKGEALATADFVLENSVAKRNASTCDGEQCAVAQLVNVDAREVTVRATKISFNENDCKGARCDGGDVIRSFPRQAATIEGTELRENGVSCEGEKCGIGSILFAVASTGIRMRSVVAESNTTVCRGVDCGVSGHIDVQTDEGDVGLDGFELPYGYTGCFGDGCEIGPTIRLLASGEVAIADSSVIESLGECEGLGCHSDPLLEVDAGSATIARSELTRNLVHCVGDGCTANATIDLSGELAAVALNDTSIVGNYNDCVGSECHSGGLTSIRAGAGNVTLELDDVSNNIVFCKGDGCSADGVLSAAGKLGVEMDTISLKENSLKCFGVRCGIEPVAALSDGGSGVAVDGLVAQSNLARCEGANCRSSEIFLVGSGPSSLGNSRFVGNVSQCEVAGCTAGLGGALHNAASVLTVFNTTFAQNETDGVGAAAFNDASSEMVLDSSVMVENLAGLRGTAAFGGYGGAIYNDAANGRLGILRL